MSSRYSTNKVSLLGGASELSVLKPPLSSCSMNLHDRSMVEVENGGLLPSGSHSCSLSFIRLTLG